ncbi:MAG: hypothetical protein OEX01_08235 [Candidatus Bathyarchaeota archaeon]|nr:hypothetical protein [Candidatus Bathyarchaeota archaeon]
MGQRHLSNLAMICHLPLSNTATSLSRSIIGVYSSFFYCSHMKTLSKLQRSTFCGESPQPAAAESQAYLSQTPHSQLQQYARFLLAITILSAASEKSSKIS